MQTVEFEVQRFRNSILTKLADACEQAQAKANDYAELAEVSRGAQAAVYLGKRDGQIARSRALLDAAKIVKEA